MKGSAGRAGWTTLRRAVAAAALLLASATAARADLDVVTAFGHGGQWIADAATPLDVGLRNSGSTPVTARLTVTVGADGDSGGVIHERRVVVGPGVSRLEGFLVPGPTSFQPDVSVRVETEQGVPIHHGERTADRGGLDISIAAMQRVMGAVRGTERRAVGVMYDPQSVIAARLQGMKFAKKDDDRARPLAILSVSPEALRTAPLSLDGLETLIVCDPDSAFCGDPAHLDALLDWVATGGCLLVSLGENASEFAASPLAAALPADFGAARREDYVVLASALVGKDLGTERYDGPVVRLASHPGSSSFAGGYAVAAPLGAGRIVVTGLDLRYLLRWLPDSDKIVGGVAIPFLGADEELPWNVSAQQMFTGEVDLADPVGRLLRQDAFRPPGFPVVLFALFLYVLVVGPIDWLVLRRMKKERYTTFTFAAAVAVFTLVAYGASFTLFASDAVTNHVTFVRFDDGGRPGRELVRVHDMAGFYAPNGGTRDLDSELPGTILGANLPGLAGSGVGAALPVQVRAADPLRAVGSVEIGFRSQRTVHSSFAATAARTIDVAPGDSADRVVVTNTLPIDIEDCEVYLDDERVCAVGTVRSGASVMSAPSHMLMRRTPAMTFDSRLDHADENDRRSARSFLADVVAAARISDAPLSAYRTLRRAGVVAGPPRAGHVLLVATSSELPFVLPGGAARGRRHVVLSKEARLQ